MKAQEERSQGDLKKEAGETRIKEVQQGKPARERQDSAAIGGRKLQGVFLAPPGITENLQGIAGPGSSMRERSLLQGVLHSWQQELDREREARKDKDLQRKDIPEENRHLREEQDAQMLELSVTIHMLEGRRTSSRTGNRSCPPVARGVGGGLQGLAETNLTLTPRKGPKKGKVSSP